MAQPTELTRLAEQRRLLAAQSEALRRQLAEDFSELQNSTAWIDRVYTLARAGRALWPILAGVLGVLVARRGGGVLRKASKLLAWWRVLNKVTGLWRSFRTQSS